MSFKESHIEWIDDNYNESMENGFCLFGHVDVDEVVVERVEYVDNPFSQTDGSMIFTCVPQILVRSGRLVMDDEFSFVGAVHTHPDVARLSSIDRNTFQMFDPLLETFGVYNGTRLSMYADPGSLEGMHVGLRY